MSCEIVVRYARPEDLENRRELVRNCFSIKFWDAFLLFFCQEVTLECCVLGLAVLFIFCGVSVTACTILLPAAAVFVAAGVVVYRQALADKHMQNLSSELFGLVAETQSNLLSPKNDMLHIRINLASSHYRKESYMHIVGTVSVVEFHGENAGGWVEGLAVAEEWQQCGVDAALLSSIRQATVCQDRQTLESVLTHLQPDTGHLIQ